MEGVTAPVVASVVNPLPSGDPLLSGSADATEQRDRQDHTREVARRDGGNTMSASVRHEHEVSRQLRHRRRLLTDVFANSRFNVLDAARRERWGDIERVRSEVEDAEAWIAAGVEAADCRDDDGDEATVAMRRKFCWSEESWKSTFEKLILADAATSTSTRDDILYFVQNALRLRSRASSAAAPSSRGASVSSSPSSPASPTSGDKYDELHVRRWQPQLPGDIASMSDCYHWQRSLLVNLVLQTRYVMTIAVYDNDTLQKKRDLQLKGAGRDASEQRHLLKPVLEIRKRVYASPHFEVFDDSSKGFSDRDVSTGMQQTFPTLYFAVCDDSDRERDLLESVILSDAEHCLCVILSATIEEDIWGTEGDEYRSRAPASPAGERDGTSVSKRNVKLFSGFVTHAQVTGSYQEQKGWTTYLSRRKTPTRLGMRGPRGKGRAEVVVEESPHDQQEENAAGDSSARVTRRMPGSLSVRRVLDAARVRRARPRTIHHAPFLVLSRHRHHRDGHYVSFRRAIKKL